MSRTEPSRDSAVSMRSDRQPAWPAARVYPVLDVAAAPRVEAAKESKGMSWRQLAREIGVSPSTMSRLANDLKPDVNAFAAMVRWLNIPAERFMIDVEEQRQRREREQPDLVAALAPLLRARTDLKEEDVEHLEELIASAVRRFNADRAKQED